MGRNAVAFVSLSLAIGLFGCNGGGSSGGETFDSPSEIVGGKELNVELTVSEQRNKIGDLEFVSSVYNGDYVAPVLRIKPGGVINLKLRNLNPQQPSNVHYHGLEVSPQGNSDNVFVQVEPENCFEYRIQIPENERGGMMWYHSHMMGLSETQVFNGLSGGLIIDGLYDNLPFLKGVKERVMILKDIQAEADGTVTVPDYSKPTLRSINGIVRPSISIRPGETQLWRIGNVGANLFYNLAVEGHEFIEIARDGEVRVAPLRQASLMLPPGARSEVLITGAATAGTYAFKTLAIDTGPDGDPTPEELMGTLVVSGSAGTPVTVPSTLMPSADLREQPVTNRRRIVFSENNDAGLFYINNQLYSPSRDDVVLPLGSLEEWQLVNNSQELHTFHIHQTDFQITARNGQPEEFRGYQDTVDIDVGGTVTVLIPFKNPVQVGRFVFHCHILEHEDGGMMQNIVVYDPANPNGVPDDRMTQGKVCS